MTGSSELRIRRNADLTAPRKLRHALRAFLEVFSFETEALEDIELAVGEVLANSVEHAYAANDGRSVEMVARTGTDGTLAVEICDQGTFIERARLPNRGFGLRIVRAIARDVTIETDEGTRVRMVFDTGRRAVR